jgi:hypothetical protein
MAFPPYYREDRTTVALGGGLGPIRPALGDFERLVTVVHTVDQPALTLARTTGLETEEVIDAGGAVFVTSRDAWSSVPRPDHRQ